MEEVVIWTVVMTSLGGTVVVGGGVVIDTDVVILTVGKSSLDEAVVFGDLTLLAEDVVIFRVLIDGLFVFFLIDLRPNFFSNLVDTSFFFFVGLRPNFRVLTESKSNLLDFSSMFEISFDLDSEFDFFLVVSIDLEFSEINVE